MPVNFTSQNFSKPSASTSFLQDGAPAFLGEADLLVGAFDALLDPGLLRAVGDVHELDAERLAIGALADRDDLAQGAEFEAEHVVEEDRAVEIGIGEAVRARIEFLAYRFGGSRPSGSSLAWKWPRMR